MERLGMCHLIVTFNIAAAAYRFYRSKKESESSSLRGKSEILKKTKRRHERIVRVSVFSLCLPLITSYLIRTETKGKRVCYIEKQEVD